MFNVLARVRVKVRARVKARARARKRLSGVLGSFGQGDTYIVLGSTERVSLYVLTLRWARILPRSLEKSQKSTESSLRVSALS